LYIDRRDCHVCDKKCFYEWYEKDVEITVSSQKENLLNLPVMNDGKLLLRCMCERCYNLFPYIKFHELSDKILLLKEFQLYDDIKQYIFYFLIMT